MRHTLIRADYIIPMTPDNEVIVDGAVVIDSAGRIAEVGGGEALQQKYPDAVVRLLRDRLIMPGRRTSCLGLAAAVH
jgi:5-methylthioadenosine/S-adenosylhomocysteine deaminase